MATDNTKAALGVAAGVFATLAYPFVRDGIFTFIRDAVTEGGLQAMHHLGEMQAEQAMEEGPREPTILSNDIFRDRAENGTAE